MCSSDLTVFLVMIGGWVDPMYYIAPVVGNWAVHEPNPNVVPGRDFKKLNKHAVVEGATNCKTMSDYRSTHDFRLKLGGETVVETKPYDTDTAFGRPTNASTAFQDLFSHSYRYDWVAEAPPADAFLEAKKPKKPAMTKSALAMVAVSQSKMSPVEPAPEWKMKAFLEVPPKVGHTG